MTSPAPAGTRAGSLADAAFVVLATLTVAVVGLLVESGEVSWLSQGERPLQDLFPAWGRAAFALWMLLAVLLGLVLPSVALAVWRRDRAVRAALLPYVLLLMVQVPTELVAAEIFFPNIFAVVGLLYTSYRLWQLRRSERVLASAEGPGTTGRRAARALVLSGLAFWMLNLTFLLAVVFSLVVKIP